MTNPNHLRWKCRRGMLELDLLLEQFLEHKYPHLSAADKIIFEELLELPDPVLHAYFMKSELPRKQAWREFVMNYLTDTR